MVLDYQNDDAARSLDAQQILDWQRGWQVVDPAGGSNLVTAGTGDFEYDAAAGDINAGGSIVTCSGETVDFATDIDASDDKIAVIYRDSSGDVQKNVGTAGTRDPSGDDIRSTFAPPPPSMHNVNGVVLAEVLLPSGASSVGSAELRDRRLGDDLDVVFNSITTDGLTNNITGTDDTEETVTDYPTANNDDFTDRTKITTGVSTSAKTILTASPFAGTCQLVLVTGSEGFSAADADFSEVVLWAVGNSATTIGSPIEDNTPVGRTYTVSTTELQLAMDSDTYTVRCRGVEIGGVDV